MSQDRKNIGDCPKCGGSEFTCSYNHFDKAELTIDSWEHKCPDCGLRETTAFRSDDEESNPDSVEPTVCPYCARRPA
jgi:hypothetical protein